jgi:hypothetical protein
VGVYDRYSLLFSSEISLLAAMLSSFEEVSHVFEGKGMRTAEKILFVAD